MEIQSGETIEVVQKKRICYRQYFNACTRMGCKYCDIKDNMENEYNRLSNLEKERRRKAAMEDSRDYCKTHVLRDVDY